MRREVYEKAKDLIDDISRIEKQVYESENKQHWIAISTPDNRDLRYSLRFQLDLTEWLKSKLKEYQKEFDELN